MIFKRLVLLLTACLSLALSSCGSDETKRSLSEGVLERIKTRGEIIVATLNSPTTYYEYRDEPYGFEYELVTAFAHHLGVEPRFLIKQNISEVLSAVEKGDADVAAAGLTHTRGRDGRFLFSIPYYEVIQQVVCRRGIPCPKTIEDLAGKNVVVSKDSSYDERLQELISEYPGLKWQTDPQLGTENLLEKVWMKEIQCTVADSNIVAINRRYFPELRVCLNFTDPQPLAWAMPAQAHDLQQVVNDWLKTFLESEEFSRLVHKYYSHVQVFDYVDTRRFIRHIKRRLPRYRKLFEEAASRYGFDWTLLAAMAYQESHWNPYSRSPTGVRGIMMLTLTTARELGVRNRLDPAQSIMGGARYLARLRKRLPESIKEPDRTWMVLAAYNVGLGHLMDARKLAIRLGMNPDRWSSLRKVLPLLSQKRYYRTLKHGYARGREPVIYVQRIRNYMDILRRHLEVEALKTA